LQAVSAVPSPSFRGGCAALTHRVSVQLYLLGLAPFTVLTRVAFTDDGTSGPAFARSSRGRAGVLGKLYVAWL
jgi:hypothetical protein